MMRAHYAYYTDPSSRGYQHPYGSKSLTRHNATVTEEINDSFGILASARYAGYHLLIIDTSELLSTFSLS